VDRDASKHCENADEPPPRAVHLRRLVDVAIDLGVTGFSIFGFIRVRLLVTLILFDKDTSLVEFKPSMRELLHY